jgi:hypothetical protein
MAPVPLGPATVARPAIAPVEGSRQADMIAASESSLVDAAPAHLSSGE